MGSATASGYSLPRGREDPASCQHSVLRRDPDHLYDRRRGRQLLQRRRTSRRGRCPADRGLPALVPRVHRACRRRLQIRYDEDHRYTSPGLAIYNTCGATPIGCDDEEHNNPSLAATMMAWRHDLRSRRDQRLHPRRARRSRRTAADAPPPSMGSGGAGGSGRRRRRRSGVGRLQTSRAQSGDHRAAARSRSPKAAAAASRSWIEERRPCASCGLFIAMIAMLAVRRSRRRRAAV